MLLALTGCTASDQDYDDGTTAGLDTALFMEGAVLATSIEDCTLSDGTQTTCHSITVAGFPVNHDVGPFCPSTTSAGVEEGGIWFDGNAVYDIDGPFILGLATLYNDDHWMLYDEDGYVRFTDTPEAFNAAARPLVVF
jgi:hypothetical protein